MATLAAAGLPMLQRDNSEHMVATQTLVKDMNIGVFFADMAGLHAQLANRRQLQALRENVWRQRMHFCFDYHTDDLIKYFRQVISRKFAGQEVTV